MNSGRRRPMHTCGVSAFAVAHKACLKAQDLNEPLGSMVKRVATLGSPVTSFVYALQQYLWLAIFSCFDECILALEDAIESVFPSSKHVFNEVDELVLIIETLPQKFDDALDEFPVIVEQVPLLDWAVGQAISWLKLLTSMLTHWDAGNAKEKEIVVDTGYNESNGESAAPIVGLNNEETNVVEPFPPIPDKPKTEPEKVGEKAKPCAPKGTYKEVLERGKRETIEKKETEKDGNKDENINLRRSTDVVVKVEEAEDEESKRDDNIVLKNDSILELFDSGWLTNIPVKMAIESSIPRSASCT